MSNIIIIKLWGHHTYLMNLFRGLRGRTAIIIAFSFFSIAAIRGVKGTPYLFDELVQAAWVAG